MAQSVKNTAPALPPIPGLVCKHILITGPSGSGKTYIATALAQLDVCAVDADKVVGLSGWFDANGMRMRYPLDASEAFLRTHRFLWERSRLKVFLDKHSRVILLGSSRNVFEMLDLFDRVFFLKAGRDLLTERLRSNLRTNPMGRTEHQLEYCLANALADEAIAGKFRIPMLDATASPEQLLLRVCSDSTP